MQIDCGVGDRVIYHDPTPLHGLFHAVVARRVILVVLFDNRTTLGLVKLRVKGAVVRLNQVFTDMFNRDGTSAPGVESDFLGEAEDEIDKLFGA